jgi:phosphate transport system permease protein
VKLRGRDRLFFLSLLPFPLSLAAILALIIATIFFKSVDSVAFFGSKLFTTSIWDPEHEEYGVLSPVVGSLVTSLLATLTALVLSIPLAIFISEYLRGAAKKVVALVVELASGIPTVIYAMWASTHFAPTLKAHIMEPLAASLYFIPLFSCKVLSPYTVFTAGISIGVSITPYLTSLILESYSTIPTSYREACLGIGATRYETIRILLSLIKPAIVASAVLGFARALGETTIAVATIGNSMHLSACLFSPGYTVSALIASQFGNAYLYKFAESVLYASSLVVLIIAVVLSFSGLTIMNSWRKRVVLVA